MNPALMAEESATASPPPQPSPPPPSYLGVNCNSSSKTRRFAVGTDAGFAIMLINRKLNGGSPLSLYIEAVKDGEEPVAFGPNSVLVDYGDGWKLQTLTEADLTSSGVRTAEAVHSMPIPMQTHVAHVLKEGCQLPKPIMSFLYIVKITLAFIMIFVLGAFFTLFLENLPTLILYVKSLI